MEPLGRESGAPKPTDGRAPPGSDVRFRPQGTITLTLQNVIPSVWKILSMSENNPPVPPSPAPEPPKAAEASQKKQTVRISLPPKPAGGPSIRVPAATAAPAPAAAAAAPAAAAPAAAPAAPAAAAPAKPAVPAAPAAPKAAAAKPAASAARPASIGGLDVGLALAAAVLGLAAVAAQFFVSK